LIKVIGKGSYAKVLLVRKNDNGNLYAIKALKKKYIQQKRQEVFTTIHLGTHHGRKKCSSLGQPSVYHQIGLFLPK